MLKHLPIDRVRPNPDQPRKSFDPAKLAELAASIKTHGLLQPIRVRRERPGHYLIVMGERRYRAHQLAGLTEIAAHIDDIDDRALTERAIVENLQRVDITPLEEARAFKRCLDEFEMEPAALAQRLGLKQPWRISERLSLLSLREEYQAMLERGNLTPSQGYEMSRLSAPLQDELFRLIRSGACDSYARLRASADGLLRTENQGNLFEPQPPPTAEEQAALSGPEGLIGKLCTSCPGASAPRRWSSSRRSTPTGRATSPARSRSSQSTWP